MKRFSTLFTLSLVIVLSSCHRYYTSSRFDEITSRHKTIAVLPPRMVLTGNQPKNLQPYEIALLEEKESKMFQEALFNNILKKGNRGKYILDVSLQPCTNTLALLERNNIGIRESWSMSDEELAAVLGVDAVVRTTIQKNRIMSDLASIGIMAGRKVIDAVLNRPPVIAPGINKTADIQATCTIVSKGETLWNDSYKKESDFNSPANEVIENITGNFARHFPYRKKA